MEVFHNIMFHRTTIAPVVNATAVLLCLTLSVFDAKRRGLDPTIMFGAGIASVTGALIGGNLAYAALTGMGPTSETLDVINGGKTVLGAYVGAMLFGGAYLHFYGHGVISYSSTALPFAALGYAMVRVGCFFNGCDYGSVSTLSWAVQYPAGTQAFEAHLLRGLLEQGAWSSLAIHPVQLYHSVLGVGLFFLLRNIPINSVNRLAVGMMGYGLGRFVLQFFRDDHGPILVAFDTTQWICLLMMHTGVIIYWMGTLRRKRCSGFRVWC